MKTKDIVYNRSREDFKDGDILMFKDRGLVSSLIKWRTKSPYSHAGIVAW